MIERSFWYQRNVFVTGHTGFKGSWLVAWLRMLGANVTGFSNGIPTNPSMHQLLASYLTPQKYFERDIRDFTGLKSAIENVQPEIIIHLAAQPLVLASYADPLETFSTNILGTANLLEAARSCQSVRCILNVTSDKSYANEGRQRIFVETDPMGGSDPYSASKGCSELVTTAFRNSYYKKMNIGLSSARAGNVIGGGDWAKDRLVPDLISSWAKGRSPIIRSPTAIRPWQHVLEPLSGYLELSERLYHSPSEYSEPFNFGPQENDDLNAREIAEKLAKCWGRGCGFEVATIENQATAMKESMFLQLSAEKAMNKLSWSPKLSTSNALKLTAHWYKAFYEGEDASKLTQEQIEQYEAL